MVIVSNEIRLIVLEEIGTKHRELYRKSHITHVALLPNTTQIFTSFLYFTLGKQGNPEILHDEHIIGGNSESTLEEDNSFFDISHHSIRPSEITENFRIIRTFLVRFFEIFDCLFKIITNKGHISAEVETCRRTRFEFF